MVPFPFYERLNKRQQATYRKSDATPRLDLPEPARFVDDLRALKAGLEADDKPAVTRASVSLSKEICLQFAVPPPVVKVLSKRPSDSDSELHGLYEREADGSALLRVWMRTAAHERPAAFRTYLRTLTHEVLHHLDFVKLGLEDTFHTQGFFQRESSLVRQLLAAIGETPGRPTREARTERDEGQLELFGK